MTFKKPLCAVMAIFMLLTLTACKSGKLDKLTIKLNGVTVKSPLTVEKLGDDYSVFFGVVAYKDDLIAFAVFDEDATESDERKKKIKMLTSFNVDSIDAPTGLSVNGFFTGYTKSQAQDMIGEPTEKVQSSDIMTNDPMEAWLYREEGAAEDDNYLVICFDKYVKSWDIIVNLE